jgi:phage terminase large subunit-like protein
LDDLLAIAVLGREKITRRWLLWTHAWAHNSVLERRKSEAPRLRDLEQTGDLQIVSEMETAFLAVANIAAQVDAAGLLHAVGLDPMGVGAIVDALAMRDIEGDDRVVGVSQGWTLNGAIKTAEVKLADGSLLHCGQELNAWAVGNAMVEPKGNAVTITKQAAGTAKIDPLMAALNSVALMSRNPDAMGPHAYEIKELLVL